jgi:hypothetical protein
VTLTFALAGLLAIVLVLAVAWRYYSYRFQYHHKLAERRSEFLTKNRPIITVKEPGTKFRDEFDRKRLIRVQDFVAPETLNAMRTECLENLNKRTRSYLPTHKKGGTISYESLHYCAPSCVAFFHATETRAWLSDAIGEKVVPTADHDQSTCSLLVYTDEGDHINWHYDHNFYNGRHFTVLLSLENRGTKDGGVSHSMLQRKHPDGTVEEFDTSENTLVLFEGTKVLHRATPLGPNEFRALLSMTFSTNPTLSWYKEVVRRFKDIAFFGVKVLWK